MSGRVRVAVVVVVVALIGAGIAVARHPRDRRGGGAARAGGFHRHRPVRREHDRARGCSVPRRGEAGGRLFGRRHRPSRLAVDGRADIGGTGFRSPVAASSAPGPPRAVRRDPGRAARAIPAQLKSFLREHPDKGTAWARVQGLAGPADIDSFVDGLAPVILTKDTWVTNHGFTNGVANPIPAVLQAGTAVMVDNAGVPRVKCACGNPLCCRHRDVIARLDEGRRVVGLFDRARWSTSRPDRPCRAWNSWT